MYQRMHVQQAPMDRKKSLKYHTVSTINFGKDLKDWGCGSFEQVYGAADVIFEGGGSFTEAKAGWQTSQLTEWQ